MQEAEFIDELVVKWDLCRSKDAAVRRAFGVMGRVYRMGDKWVWFETDKPWDLTGIEITLRDDRLWQGLRMRNGLRIKPVVVGKTVAEVLKELSCLK